MAERMKAERVTFLVGMLNSDAVPTEGREVAADWQRARANEEALWALAWDMRAAMLQALSNSHGLDCDVAEALEALIARSSTVIAAYGRDTWAQPCTACGTLPTSWAAGDTRGRCFLCWPMPSADAEVAT